MRQATGRLHLITKEYALLFSVLALLVAATVIYNTVTDSWGKQLVTDAEAAAASVESEIKAAADIFDFCTNFFSMYISDPFNSNNSNEISDAFSSIFEESALKSKAARGYFYNINYSGLSGYVSEGDPTVHILRTLSQYEYPRGSEAVWQIAFNSLTGDYSIVYLKPYFINGEYGGYFGLELDSDYIASQLPKENGNASVSVSLLTADGYVIIHNDIEAGEKLEWNRRYKNYTGELLGSPGVTRIATIEGVYAAAHVLLSTGHILIYETPQADVISQNLMLIFFFLLSVSCILLLYAKNERGILLIDLLADKIFGNIEIDKTSETRARVSLLLTLSVIVMLFYRLVCVIFVGTGFLAVGLLIFAILGIVYLVINFKHYIKHNWLTALIAISAPPIISGIVILAGSSTETLTFVEGAWTLIGAAGPIFVYKKRFNRMILPLFSIMLFTTLFLLAVFFSTPLGYSTYIYFSNLFFVGFSLFAAAMLFAGITDNSYAEMSDALEKLQNAQSSLVQHEKMVTLGKLIAGVAHEINTPIGAIKASAEILESSLEETLSDVFIAGTQLSDESFLNYVRLLRIAADSIKEMRSTSEIRKSRAQMRKFLEEIDLPSRNEVQQMLERMEICDIEKVENNIGLFFSPDIIPVATLAIKTLPMISSFQTSLMATARVSKIVFALKSYAHSNQSGERAQADLQATIETVLMLYYSQIKQGVKIVQNYEKDLPCILANADELSQVWTNLIQNALHAMNYTGTLTISAQRRGLNIAVSIADTGTGIAPELAERIFEPFFTTKPLGEGSGLGLDICRRIIRGHSGELTVESTLGKGSVFTAILPIGG